MPSQIGADKWVMSVTEPGFYVDVGAWDGVVLSNTLALERAGWPGVCAEPNPIAFRALRKQRRCKCVRKAIYGESGLSLPFHANETRGGLTEHLDDRSLAEKSTQIKVDTVSLNELLQFASAPERIAYISIDTEGSEIEIVKAFDFGFWDVKCWTIEHNDYLYGDSTRSNELREIFVAQGYEARIVEQDIWFHRP